MNRASLVFIDLYDEKFRFDKYWPKLENVDVSTPKTTILELDFDADNQVKVPTKQIQTFMAKHDLEQAFIRSGYKAATDRLRKGSFISGTSDKEINRTVESLISQHRKNGIPHGNKLVVREWIDLDYCTEPTHSHEPEIRFFIEDGEILHWTPKSQLDTSIDCPCKYSFIEERLSGTTLPIEIVEAVASEFEGSKYPWSVDVVLDAHGKWWVTEMHIDGVYYNEDSQKWMNVCGHGDIEELSPRWTHSAALPEM